MLYSKSLKYYKSSMTEEWKVCKEDESYEISSIGRCRNRKRGRINKAKKERYLRHSLSGKLYLAHRLVASAFIPNDKNLPCVNHKDGNKYNNSIDNLEWCTQKENIRHSWESGLAIKRCGEKKGKSATIDDMHVRTIATLIKKIDRDILSSYLPYKGNLQHKRNQLRRLVLGERWPHLNFLFITSV